MDIHSSSIGLVENSISIGIDIDINSMDRK